MINLHTAITVLWSYFVQNRYFEKDYGLNSRLIGLKEVYLQLGHTRLLPKLPLIKQILSSLDEIVETMKSVFQLFSDFRNFVIFIGLVMTRKLYIVQLFWQVHRVVQIITRMYLIDKALGWVCKIIFPQIKMLKPRRLFNQPLSSWVKKMPCHVLFKPLMATCSNI